MRNNWRFGVVAVIAAIWIPLLIVAQEANRDRLSFEVATIKTNKSEDHRERGQFLPGGRFSATNYTLRMLVGTAYEVLQKQTAGGPAWIDSERYDIEAKPESGVIAEGDNNRNDKIREMIRSLLKDRFKAVVHREMKEQPIYALVISKGGAKLTKAKIDEKDCPDTIQLTLACRVLVGGQGRGLDGRTIKMSELAHTLTIWTDRTVVDKTGINGTFDIKLDPWLPLRQVAGADDREVDLRDPSRPSLFVLLEARTQIRGAKGRGRDSRHRQR